MPKVMLALVVAVLTVSVSAFAASVRVSTLGGDFVLRQTLFNALQADAGKVAQIKLEGENVVLAANRDQLSCSTSGCTLNWDTSSATYPQDAAAFSSALYVALSDWASSPSGAADPAVHRVVYAQTGSVIVTATERYGSDDHVECSLIKGAGGTSTTDCSLVVSDVIDGAGPELQTVYSGLLAAKSWIGDQTKALIASVSSPAFATPGKVGQIELVHTLYTDLLDDGYVVTGSYAYTHPIVEDGTVVSDGINLTLTGAQSPSGTYLLQAAQAQSYVLNHPIPGIAATNAELATKARAAKLARRARLMLH